MSETRKPTLELLLQLAIEARLAELHVSLPCKVLKYDAAKQTVDLQPLIKRTRVGLDGTKESKEIPSLQKVPVAFPRTAGGWITFPIQAGDVGFVTFAERNIGDWMGKSAGEVVESTDRTLHPLGGAWFFPGGYPSASPLPGGADGANVVIHAEEKLDLGEKGLTDANNFVALSKLVLDEMNKIRTALHNHSHQVVLGACTAGGNTGTVATISNPSVPSLTEPKATKVRAK